MTAVDGEVLGASRVVGDRAESRAFNIVLLAEGYRRDELGEFGRDAETLAGALLRTTPFDRLRAAINIHRVDVASADSGVGGRTYFDAAFGSFGHDPLLTCDDLTALTVAGAQVPAYGAVIVQVNTGRFGGSGGAVATLSRAPGVADIALHELGHAAFALADEYDHWAGGGEPGQAHHPVGEPAEPNVTLDPRRETLKWRQFVPPPTPLPTTFNPDCSQADTQVNPYDPETVGAYEGAHYYHCGAYRPQYTCTMRELGAPLCAVCQRAVVDRLAHYL